MTHIRPYDVQDKAQLIQLFRLNTPAYFCAEEQQDLEAFLDTETEYYHVAETGGKIVACGGCNIEGDTGCLSWYIVHPAWQGKGIGREMAMYNLDILKRTPTVRQIEVRTSQLVYPFYEKLGFELVYTEADYWGTGMHLYSMIWKDNDAHFVQ